MPSQLLSASSGWRNYRHIHDQECDVNGSLSTYILIGVVLSLVLSAAIVALVGLLIVRLPPDYFRDTSPRDFWVGRHPLVRRIGLFAKNFFGVVLIALGILLSLPGVPGPGILTIFIGLVLLDFPRKRPLERWLVGRPTILHTIDRLRRRYGRPPLERPLKKETTTR